jgi:thymidine kinase
MFSGKSESSCGASGERRSPAQRVQVFKPSTDVRPRPDRLVTRDLRELAAVSVADAAGAPVEAAVSASRLSGVDEAQFFDEALAELATELADAGIRVVIAGLDQDYSRRPFGPMPKASRDSPSLVDKMHAVCVRCGAPAHYSQRIAGGADQVQVGDTDAYEARCRRCYEVFTPR